MDKVHRVAVDAEIVYADDTASVCREGPRGDAVAVPRPGAPVRAGESGRG